VTIDIIFLRDDTQYSVADEYQRSRMKVLRPSHRLHVCLSNILSSLYTTSMFNGTAQLILSPIVLYDHTSSKRVAPKLMPPIYFHGNYNTYKEHHRFQRTEADIQLRTQFPSHTPPIRADELIETLSHHKINFVV
jgi:hypothetical protein